jgi:hypothetical protein
MVEMSINLLCISEMGWSSYDEDQEELMDDRYGM